MSSSGDAASDAIARRAMSALETLEYKRGELNATRRAMRLTVKAQPELHVLGELCGGTGFGAGRSVACKWAVEAGEKWEIIEGVRGGQTQTDGGAEGVDAVVWSHPIDVHFIAGALRVSCRAQ